MDFFANFSSGQLIGFAGVVGGVLIAVTAIVVSQWRRVRVAEIEGALKQQMLDKGMSAADIEKVMNAGQEPGESPITSTGNEALDKAALAQRMIDNGYEGEDIERVLKAYQPPDKPFVNKG